MRVADVRSHPCKTLTESQREQFFADGFLVVENLVDQHWLSKLKSASDAAIDASRNITESDQHFVLEAGHSAQVPKLRRLSSPVSYDETFWSFAAESLSADVAADVCGPDVKFYHAKLNFKWPGGGQKFDWHQDIPAWPHTDYSPVTVGLYLDDCREAQGPLRAIRGSHLEPLHSMYDGEGRWVLRIPEEDLASDWQERTVSLTGSAGSLVLLNCRTIHGSASNHSDRMRPLLLNVYSSADSMPYVVNPIPSPYEGAIVRGKPARFSSHDPEGCELPPDWSGGYVGPWAFQEKGRTAKAG